MNDFPPAVKYLFSWQILDESTHEMLYLRDAGHPEARRGGAGLPPAPGERNPVTKVRFDYAIYNSCGLCREVCDEMAIRPKLLEPRHLYEVQAGKCTGCGECLEYCPAPAALVPYEAWTPN
jgi:ferredoxin